MEQLLSIVLALVPIETLCRQSDMSSAVAEGQLEGQPSAGSGEVARFVGAVEAAIAASGERARADAAMLASLQVLLDQANSRADRAEQGKDEARARADALADQVHVLQARAEAAEHAQAEASVSLVALSEHLDAFEAEATARRSAGLVARLLAAWKGE